jgi:hypothetical protein
MDSQEKEEIQAFRPGRFMIQWLRTELIGEGMVQDEKNRLR